MKFANENRGINFYSRESILRPLLKIKVISMDLEKAMNLEGI